MTGTGKYGIIQVIEAADDTDALVPGGCKIAKPTGVENKQGPAYTELGILDLLTMVWHCFTDVNVS